MTGSEEGSPGLHEGNGDDAGTAGSHVEALLCQPGCCPMTSGRQRGEHELRVDDGTASVKLHYGVLLEPPGNKKAWLDEL
jgi:hypothetical protein